MAKTIWKYELIPGKTALALPPGAQFLAFASQRTSLCVWFLVDPTADIHETIVLEIYGTGSEVPETQHAGNFLGTSLMHGDGLVWHLFRESVNPIEDGSDRTN